MDEPRRDRPDDGSLRLGDDILCALKGRAREAPARVILPEGFDPRVLEAAVLADSEGLARTIILGKKKEITAAAANGA